MSTATQIINKAASYIGVKESPANSNNVIFNTDYYGRQVNGASYPWCCAFVWDIFRLCGASNLFYDGKKTAYCPTVYNWAKSKNLIVSKTSAQKGDIVLFDWGSDGVADHIGLIESYSGGVYRTIEGNTSVGNDSNGGEVMRRNRYASSIQAIIRPAYNGQTSATTASTTSTNRGYLMKGDSGSEVKTMQTMLIKCGYSCGSYGADGEFGDATDKALRQFQKDYKLEVDGEYGKNSKAKLTALYTSKTSTSSSKKVDWIAQLQTECNKQGLSKQVVDGEAGPNTLAGCPTLRQGSTGEIVKILQQRLNNLGYSCGAVDGIFGGNTVSAVRSYQKAKKLTVDGIVGKNTWKKLLGL